MQSQLLSASITNGEYTYRKDGNISQKEVDSEQTDYEYDTTSGGSVFDSDIMTKAGTETLVWNDNGQLKTGLSSIAFEYNWDGKLRKVDIGDDSIHLKYDPLGNRIWRQTYVDSSETTTTRKYIVDISGKLPTILCEVDTSDSSLKKSYIYSNNDQILCQRNGDQTADEYFCVTDRLGSVRQVIDMSGSVKRNYTYSPFGQLLESGTASGAPSNPFMFAGQWFDDEISQYYLRARRYDPALMRFTSRDPVQGEFKRPLTLHEYLYCGNNPINYVDPDGRIAIVIGGSFSGNITAADLGSAFVGGIKGLRGIGALVAHTCAILPAMTMLTEMSMITNHVGWGGTAGAGFVAAWDHTRGLSGLNDRDAWSWGTMQWVAGGYSGSTTGTGGSIMLDVGLSNARHVSQLAGPFVEGGVSGPSPLWGIPMSGTLSRGMNEDGSWNDIWLGTISGGAATPGYEGHLFVGYSFVQEYGGW